LKTNFLTQQPNSQKEELNIMPYKNVNATLSAEDLQAIKDAFATILQKLPFLINLSVDERKSTFKAGPNSLSFIQNALVAAQNNPTIFPESFDLAAFQKDAELLAFLTEVKTIAESVISQIDDTRLAVGGEAMQAASQVYNYTKAAAKTTPGLRPIAEQLGERFQKVSRRKPESKN
jgi:hypothetical protein